MDTSERRNEKQEIAVINNRNECVIRIYRRIVYPKGVSKLVLIILFKEQRVEC